MIYAYLVLQAMLLLLSFGGFLQVRKFLSRHNAISDYSHLDAFKALVRLNMYLALVYIAMGIPAIVMSVYLGWEYGLFGIFAVMAVNIPHFMFSKYLRSLEEQARQLHCLPQFSAEFKMVGETWFKKALPNF